MMRRDQTRITKDKSHGVLESALPRCRSAAGAGVWSLAVLVVARLVTWSWGDSRKRAIVTGIAAAVEVGSGTG